MGLLELHLKLGLGCLTQATDTAIDLQMASRFTEYRLEKRLDEGQVQATPSVKLELASGTDGACKTYERMNAFAVCVACFDAKPTDAEIQLLNVDRFTIPARQHGFAQLTDVCELWTEAVFGLQLLKIGAR